MELPRMALSVRQPWAWAIIHAGKDIENRSLAAVMHGMKPGRVAIHAAKGMTRKEYDDAGEFMATFDASCPPAADLVRGAIIGAVTVVEIVKSHPSPWWMGPRGLVLADPVACEPIPAVGALGYFKWTPSGGSIAEAARWMLPVAAKPEKDEALPDRQGTLL